MSWLAPISHYFLCKFSKNEASAVAFKTIKNPADISFVDINRDEKSFWISDQYTKENSVIDWSFAPNIKVSFQFGKDRLEVNPPSWGLAPIFVAQHENSFYLSSHLQLLTSLNPSLNIFNETIESDLLKKAYLPNGKTTLQNVIKVQADQKCICSFDQGIQLESLNLLPKKWFSESLTSEWVEHFWTLMKKSVQNIYENDLRLLALSGGNDSRLILAALTPGQRKEIIAYTKSSPYINESEDNDYQVALLVKEKFKLKHQSIHQSKDYEKFLIPEFESAPVISGLYGGEFFGGAMLSMLPESMETPKDNHEMRELFLATLGTSRSIFYYSTTIGWSTPYLQLQFTMTPFVSEELLEHRVLLKWEESFDYKIFAKLWRLEELAEFAKVPFQSDLTIHNSFPTLDTGKNPKKYHAANEPLQLSDIVQKNIAFLKELLSRPFDRSSKSLV